MQPSRGNLLVKPIETQESVGGVVLLEDTRQRWSGQQCEVVAIGKPAYCEDGDCGSAAHVGIAGEGGIHLMELRVGDWLVVRPRSYVATDVDKRWVVRQDDVLARLIL